MIPVELKNGLITIADLPERAADAENDSHLIYGAQRRRRRGLWTCFRRRRGRSCRARFRANRRQAFRSCRRRRCGAAFRVR